MAKLSISEQKIDRRKLSRIGKDILIQHNVALVFIVLSLAGLMLTELSFVYVANELLVRFSRNLFLVLSLIIPIMAGVGLNFGIVVGAMAGQIAIIAVTYWGIAGLPGFLLCILIATPFAILFGWLTGRLYNKTKGQEMIAGMILSYFAAGIYQFVFLVLAGSALLPFTGSHMLKPDGRGLRNTIALNGSGKEGEGIKYALDGYASNKFLKIPIAWVLLAVTIIVIVFLIYKYSKISQQNNTSKLSFIKRRLYQVGSLFAVSAFMTVSLFIPMGIISQLSKLKVPILTLLVLLGLCLFNVWIMRTKLGQDFRTIGQSQPIGKVAGIHVNRTRIIAVVISTVLAAWGQIIFLQNIGTMNTYGSHVQVGYFAVAAILIGGASVKKATIKHAILGIILFQSVFILSPTAGKALFGDAQIGEFFRAFVVYFVIGLSLVLHAKKHKLGHGLR